MRHFQSIVELGEEIVELREKPSLLTFLRMLVKKCLLAHLLSVTMD